MKGIVLISLICIVGAASAQEIFTGEGYGRSQLSFFNGPSTTGFDPFVEKFWESYVHNSPNMSRLASNPASTMNIWFNTFPMNFNQPLQVKNSSFTPGVSSAGTFNQLEWHSIQLKRNTLSRLNIDQSWKYTPIYKPISAQKSSFYLGKDENMSATESASSGQIISQGIRALFSN